ncbi:hypothetical protein [Ralstonia chuxiongensis]|uniref:hypothetical protein n=1 Tax=Ralstonia chuxiongensis TaxID=2957504 RepID=UPI0028F64530|nr:hypothetical protein [Ralstonia chuxiongensis]CAJ0781248.1 hypothetical protein R8510_04849 [Ralstonia chuxiongensis]
MGKSISNNTLDPEARKFADWLIEKHTVSEPQINGVSDSMLLLVYAVEESLHKHEDMRTWGISEMQWRDAIWWALEKLERREQLPE